MTLSKSERILARLETIADGVNGLTGRVWRDRWEALARNEMSAIVIEPQSEDDDLTVIPFADTTLLVNLDILISGSPLSTLADPIRVDLHSRLMADRSLDGLALDLYPAGRAWQAVSGEIGALRCAYAVKYRTSLTDLTT